MKSFQDTIKESFDEHIIIEAENTEGGEQKTGLLSKLSNIGLFRLSNLFKGIPQMQESKMAAARRAIREKNKAELDKLKESKKSAIEDMRIEMMKARNSKAQRAIQARLTADINRAKTAKEQAARITSKYDKLKGTTEIPSPAEQAHDEKLLTAYENTADPEVRSELDKMKDAIFELTHETDENGNVVPITDPEKIKKNFANPPAHLKQIVETMQQISHSPSMEALADELADPNSKIHKIAAQDALNSAYEADNWERVDADEAEAQSRKEEIASNKKVLEATSKKMGEYFDKKEKADWLAGITDQDQLYSAAGISADMNDDEKKAAIEKLIKDKKPALDGLTVDTLMSSNKDDVRNALETRQSQFNADGIKEPDLTPAEQERWNDMKDNCHSADELKQQTESVMNEYNEEEKQNKEDLDKIAATKKAKQSYQDEAKSRMANIRAAAAEEAAGSTTVTIDGKKMTMKEYMDSQKLTPGESFDNNGKVGFFDKEGKFHEKPATDSDEWEDYEAARTESTCLQDPKQAEQKIEELGNYTAKMGEDGKLEFKNDKGEKITAEQYAQSRVTLHNALDSRGEIERKQKELAAAIQQSISEGDKFDPSKISDPFIKDVVSHPGNYQTFINDFADSKYPVPEDPGQEPDDNNSDAHREWEKKKRKYDKAKEAHDSVVDSFAKDNAADLEDGEDDEAHQKLADSGGDVDADDNDTDAVDDNGKKVLKNPAQVWHKKKNKQTGKPSKNYYNSKGDAISPKEFEEKMKRYQAKQKAQATPAQESLSFPDLIKYDMIYEHYGEDVSVEILLENQIDEGKFREWMKRKAHSVKDSVKNYISSKSKSLRDSLKSAIKQ